MADLRWVAVAALLLLPACSGDEDARPSRSELVDAMVDGGLEPTEARCWVGEVYDHLSTADMRAIESADATYDGWADRREVAAAVRKCQP